MGCPRGKYHFPALLILISLCLAAPSSSTSTNGLGFSRKLGTSCLPEVWNKSDLPVLARPR